jgi:hypothetical protein
MGKVIRHKQQNRHSLHQLARHLLLPIDLHKRAITTLKHVSKQTAVWQQAAVSGHVTDLEHVSVDAVAVDNFGSE